MLSGFAQKIELRWKSFLCGPLRISAYLCVLCVNGPFNAESRRDTQRPQRKQIRFATFCAKPSRPKLRTRQIIRTSADFES